MLQPLDLGNSLMVMLVGITIVFIGLVVLIFLIKILVKATDGIGKKKPGHAVEVTSIATPRQVDAPVQAAQEPEQDEAALVAAITAALAVVMERDASTFVVRRVRRVSGAPSWSRLGRENQITCHF